MKKTSETAIHVTADAGMAYAKWAHEDRTSGRIPRAEFNERMTREAADYVIAERAAQGLALPHVPTDCYR